MDNRQEILAWMDGHGVAYELMEHPAAHTMEDIEAFGISAKGLVGKNLFLRDSQKGRRHYLVTVCGDKPVDLKKLGEALGDRLSFASEGRLQKYLRLEQGAVSPLGALFDTDGAVAVYLDKELQAQPRVGVHPGDNTATVFLAPEALAGLIEGTGHKVHWVEL